MEKNVMDSIEKTEEIFMEVKRRFHPLSDDYFKDIGLTKGEAFQIFFEQACTTYRGLMIESRFEEKHGSEEAPQEEKTQEREEEPATDKQLRYIRDLSKKKELYEIVHMYLSEIQKTSIYELTKKEASTLLYRLKNAQKSQ